MNNNWFNRPPPPFMGGHGTATTRTTNLMNFPGQWSQPPPNVYHSPQPIVNYVYPETLFPMTKSSFPVQHTMPYLYGPTTQPQYGNEPGVSSYNISGNSSTISRICPTTVPNTYTHFGCGTVPGSSSGPTSSATGVFKQEIVLPPMNVPPPPINPSSIGRNSDSTYRRTRSKSRSSRHRSRSRRRGHRGRSSSRSNRHSRKRYRSRSIRRSRSRQRSRTRQRESTRSRDSEPTTNKRPERFSERDEILGRWKRNYCYTEQKISKKLEDFCKNGEDIISTEQKFWTRSAPAELYYEKIDHNSKVSYATPRLIEMSKNFKDVLIDRSAKVNSSKPVYKPPTRKNRIKVCRHKSEKHGSSSDSDDELSIEEEYAMEELQLKQQHPDRLHPEMWFNDPGEMNDGPLCRCSHKSRKSGIRHGIYPGESPLPKCNLYSNNGDKLFHYRVIITPPTNFLIKAPTIIQFDEHEYIFEGFSILSHTPLNDFPPCKVIRFNIEYTVTYYEEKLPENFTVAELDMFSMYLFKELLELVDLDIILPLNSDNCPMFHFMPRFVRELEDHGKEILCMQQVMKYLLENSKPLIESDSLEAMVKMSQYEWQNLADELKGMIVVCPGKKPSALRVDQLDRNIDLQKEGNYSFPEIVHFGIRPPQLSYAGNPEYQKAWREYVKYRHLIANMSKVTFDDKRKLESKENKLQEMRTQGQMKRDVTVAVSSEGFYRTGIMCDIVQHAMLMPVLVCHLRFHASLDVLEKSLEYKFKNRALLQLALTHPSYRENFGTNPDHARNTLTNCGIRQPEYGDRRIHYMNTRKRGINTLINIMSRFGRQEETESRITHNERLEFLGDAVVEFLSSIHLFFRFPDLEEGGLATYRAAIVQNQHLALLAKVLKLDQFMLYAHGSDLCHDLELKHAMANCYEALMGALFLDGGIDVADKVFSKTLYGHLPRILRAWVNLPKHPIQAQEPNGDRHWIEKFGILKKLTEFEESVNIKFKNIRLLARAFTDRSVGYTNLTMGSNQRLEFLGDTVLQLIASEFLYRHFPEHHEGHLSLLRSSLVNNRTQAVVCDDLGMAQYAIYSNPKPELKTKDRADLLEAFIGALYVDRGMRHCERFCEVTLFPRLRDFIMNQDWNDPKSKLQQCCLTLRSMEGGEPDIPVYKVIECKGPTNTRVYTVAVYFRGERLASAMGHSIQQAEMNAAKKALEISHDLFPQLDHQKRVIAKSMKKQKRNRGTKQTCNQLADSKCPESYSKKRFRSTSKSRSPSSRSRGSKEKGDTHSPSKSKRSKSREDRGGGSEEDYADIKIKEVDFRKLITRNVFESEEKLRTNSIGNKFGRKKHPGCELLNKSFIGQNQVSQDLYEVQQKSQKNHSVMDKSAPLHGCDLSGKVINDDFMSNEENSKDGVPKELDESKKNSLVTMNSTYDFDETFGTIHNVMPEDTIETTIEGVQKTPGTVKTKLTDKKIKQSKNMVIIEDRKLSVIDALTQALQKCNDHDKHEPLNDFVNENTTETVRKTKEMGNMNTVEDVQLLSTSEPFSLDKVEKQLDDVETIPDITDDSLKDFRDEHSSK